MHDNILYYTMLYYTLLYYTILYYTILRGNVRAVRGLLTRKADPLVAVPAAGGGGGGGGGARQTALYLATMTLHTIVYCSML